MWAMAIWRGQHQAWRARFDEEVRQAPTAIYDRFQKWWGPYQAWRARFREQQRQPACYSLIAVQRATAVAKWLLGLSGAGTVLAFTLYIQSYLSILSIKNDCVIRCGRKQGRSRVRAGVSGVRDFSAVCHCLAASGGHGAELSKLVESLETAAATART